jgi:hypothetical protein
MQLETVTQDILDWVENFVEKPHPALGGWPPCPFARQARLNRKVEVVIGIDPYYDMKSRAGWGMGNYEVIVYAYDPAVWDYAQFSTALRDANQEYLLGKDLLVLEDHPADPEIVNGVSMNQGTYALALVQSLSKLDAAAAQMHHKGFYDSWPSDYLELLFQHRKDPRA